MDYYNCSSCHSSSFRMTCRRGPATVQSVLRCRKVATTETATLETATRPQNLVTNSGTRNFLEDSPFRVHQVFYSQLLYQKIPVLSGYTRSFTASYFIRKFLSFQGTPGLLQLVTLSENSRSFRVHQVFYS